MEYHTKSPKTTFKAQLILKQEIHDLLIRIRKNEDEYLRILACIP